MPQATTARRNGTGMRSPKARTNGARTRSPKARTSARTTSRSTSALTTAARKAKVPALVGTAAAAIASGVVLGSRVSKRGRLRATTDELARIGRAVGEVGLRVGIGDLDMELRKAKSDPKSRQSPLEGLVTALTSRSASR
jgi:hypothetical protein